MNTQEIPLFLRDYDYIIEEDGHIVVNEDLRLFRDDGYSEIYLIDNLHVKGNVYIDEVESVTIGEHVHIDGNLTIYECNELKIPSWPSVGGDVDFNYNDIYAFPQVEIVANGKLYITNSTFFSCALPSKITAYGDVILYECQGEKLKKIETMRCFGNASISFNDVDIIPNDVFVVKSLHLDSNNNFLLPDTLVVLGNLYIRDSNRLCGFKNDLKGNAIIGGFIDVRGSSTLIIESFVNVCIIHFCNIVFKCTYEKTAYVINQKGDTGTWLTRPIYDDDDKKLKTWHIDYDELRYRSLISDKDRIVIFNKLFNHINDLYIFENLNEFDNYQYVEEISEYE